MMVDSAIRMVKLQVGLMQNHQSYQTTVEAVILEVEFEFE
jgi:hypothetical protein